MIALQYSRGRALFSHLILILALASPTHAAPLFRAPFRSFDVLGPGTNSVALAKMNQDEALDLVVGSGGSTSIAVLLNSGDGTFGPPIFTPSGNPTRMIVTADLNADGYMDVAAAPVHGSRIRVFLGVGDGTFPEWYDYAAGSEPGWIAVGDVNRDGHLDLVVANTDEFYGRSVSTLLGNGDGTFRAQIVSSMGGVSPSSVALADFNGDGILDLVAGCQGGATSVYVMLGLGDGRFGTVQSRNSGYSPSVVETGDLNEDGRPDFVAGGGYSGDVSIHYGMGAGTFENRVSIPIPGAPVVHLADVDHDGHLDIVTPSAVMRGHGDRTFESPIRFQTDRSSGAVAVGDLDGDGRADLVTASPYPGTFSILEGHGDGTFGGPPQVPTVPFPYAIAAGDVNDDGRIDIAAASLNDHLLTIHLGDGVGGLSGRIDVPGDLAPFEIGFTDLDGDGSPDLVGVSGGIVWTLLGDGSGSFGQRRDFTAGPGAVSMVTGDFNHDGRPDVVSVNEGSYQDVRPYDFIPDSTVSILSGAGDGTLTNRVDLVSGNTPYVVRVADMNRDGNEDLVVLNGGAASLAILMGNGDGTFRPRREFAVESYATAFTLADLDGDQVPDAAVANHYGEVSFFFGNGDGTLRAGSEISDPGSLQWIVSGDWNGDGKIDLATTRENGNTIHLLMNRGDGTFTRGDYLGAGEDPARVVVTDLDGDGQADLVAANQYGSSMSILLGIPGTPTVGVATLLGTDISPRHVRLSWLDPWPSPAELSVERRTAHESWRTLGVAHRDGDQLSFVDDSVTPGGRYAYRLRGVGGAPLSPEFWIDVPAEALLSLSGLLPSVAAGTRQVKVSLPTSEPARLQVFDTAGRRLLDRRLEGFAPGSHPIELAGSADWKNGIYLARLVQGAHSARAKWYLVR